MTESASSPRRSLSSEFSGDSDSPVFGLEKDSFRASGRFCSCSVGSSLFLVFPAGAFVLQSVDRGFAGAARANGGYLLLGRTRS